MTNQVIPAEAVEAAVSDEAFKAASDTYMEVLTDLRLKEGGGFKVAWQNRRALRAALEAAAPYMLRAAKAEAWEEGRDVEFQRSVMKRQADPNPYMLNNEGEK